MNKCNEVIKLIEFSSNKGAEIPVNWQLVEKNDLGAVLVNNHDQEVIISYKDGGIQFGNWSEVYKTLGNWFGIYVKQVPYEMKKAEKWLDSVSKYLDAQGKLSYKVITAGYADKGVISDLSALYLHSKGIDVESITYENPGSLPIAEKYAAEIKTVLSQDLFQSVNSQDGWFNNIHSQAGRVVNIGEIKVSDSVVSKVANTILEVGSIINLIVSKYGMINYLKGFIPALQIIPDPIVMKATADGMMKIGEKMHDFDKSLHYAADIKIIEELVDNYTHTHENFLADLHHEYVLTPVINATCDLC
jgi:hypothetical protein